MNSEKKIFENKPRGQQSDRSAARLAAVQALYQMDVAGTDLNDVLREFESNYFKGAASGEGAGGTPAEKAPPATERPDAAKPDHKFLTEILNGVLAQQGEIDPIIDEQLREGWRLNRLDSILRAILRSGTYELKECRHVPVAVIIDEYLNIAHAFFEQDEPKVVNGVLDKLARRLRNNDCDDEDKKASV